MTTDEIPFGDEPQTDFIDNVALSDDFFNAVPGYGCCTPSGISLLLEDKADGSYYLLLYPEGYPEEMFTMMEVGLKVTVMPEGYLHMTDEDMGNLIKGYERLKIERARRKLEEENG